MKNFVKNLFYAFLSLCLAILGLLIYITWMPDSDIREDSSNTATIATLKERLKIHVTELSKYESGRNNIVTDNLTPARDYIATQFSDIGLTPSYQKYTLYDDEYSNIIVNIPSKNESSSILIIGAHYDSIENSPGANDNASGVAALIELARYLSNAPMTNYQVRLIAFANEEPPYFQTDEMGSVVYVKDSLDSKDNILGMISLETLGYYSDEKNSQKYPKPFNILYPDIGNFISFVGNIQSRELVTSSISLFKKNSSMPAEGIASPALVPGIGWSDHWSFWLAGHQAIMVTDTAPYRYNHYHKSTDTADKLNYDQYAKAVYGLFKVIEGLANNGL